MYNNIQSQRLNNNGHTRDLLCEPVVLESVDFSETGNETEAEFALQSSEDTSVIDQAQLKNAFIQEAVPNINLLYNYAFKLLRNKPDADDLLQDTYLRAYRFFHTFKRGTNCKAWLFTIMKNLFINRYRKDQKQAAKVGFDDIENFFNSVKSRELDTNDLQQRIFSMLLDDEMTYALDSIQDDFRIVVILCDLEGYSYEEIASFLHCPIGTVRSRLHRGRRLLQKKLAYMWDKNNGV